MKRFLRGLCLIWVLVLAVALPAQAADLLSERMDVAYESGRQVAATVSVQLGDGAALFLQQETYDAVQKLLSDTRIVTRWAKDEAGMPAVALEIGIQDVQLLTGEVLLTGDSALLTTNWLPGKTVTLPLSALGEVIEQQPLPVQLDEQTVALFQQVGERYLAVFAAWASRAEGVYAESERETTPTDVRGGSVRADHLVVTAAQMQELLVQLAETFEQDAELQAMLGQYLAASGQSVDMPSLASALAEGMRNLAPMADGALKLDFYQDASAELVGVDFQMDPMFEGAPQSAFARYDRLIGDGDDAYAFQGRMDLEDGGMAAAKISYRTSESHVERTIDTDLLLLGMVQNVDTDPVSQITLNDKRHTVKGDGQERVDDALTLTMEQLAPDGSVVEGAMPMSALLNTVSETQAGPNGDFESDTTATLSFMGMELGAFTVKLTSGEYVPVDSSGNAEIDLSKATEEEQQALLQELQTGMAQQLMGAIAVLPPELLQMMQGG